MIDSPHETMPSLPKDAEALRALVLATFVERDTAVSERDTLLAQNDRLRHLLLKLTRMHFGARSERLPEEQLQLATRCGFLKPVGFGCKPPRSGVFCRRQRIG